MDRRKKSIGFHAASSRCPPNSMACSELINHHITGGDGSRDGGGDGGEEFIQRMSCVTIESCLGNMI